MPPSYCSSSSDAFRHFHRDPRHQSYMNLPMDEYDQSMKEFSKITNPADVLDSQHFKTEQIFSDTPK